MYSSYALGIKSSDNDTFGHFSGLVPIIFALAKWHGCPYASYLFHLMGTYNLIDIMPQTLLGSCINNIIKEMKSKLI